MTLKELKDKLDEMARLEFLLSDRGFAAAIVRQNYNEKELAEKEARLKELESEDIVTHSLPDVLVDYSKEPK